MSFSKKAKISMNPETCDEAETVQSHKLQFEPTQQQKDCHKLIMDNDIVKIGACSGSGKTSLLQYTSSENKVPSLYLAYNKAMAEEAKGKFMPHVSCMTTHSLAYRRIGKTYQHKLSRPTGRYRNVAGTGTEIALFFKIPDMQVDEETFISKNYIGLIIRDTVNKYEYSADDEITEKNIPNYHLADIKKRYPDVPMKKFIRMVLRYADDLWEERTDTFSEVLCNHDTYLKLFQLKKYKLLDYSVVYLDESQDVNGCTLDIFLNQADHAKLVLVGDKFQEIYQWRGGVNAMLKVDAEEGWLTKSFRYGNRLAKIATAILGNKLVVEGNESKDTQVGLQDSVDFNKPYTMLFRTNMELIFNAIDLIKSGEKVNVNFDIQDLTKMLKSAKALYSEELKQVKHEKIIPYTTWEDFVQESKYSGELARIVNIVEAGDEDTVIETLHKYKAKGDEKITMITAHRSKGLEWNQVVLADDFKSIYNHKGEYVGLDDGERNLLYVASTRAIEALQYNSTVQEILDYNCIDLKEPNPLSELLNENMNVRKVEDYHTADLSDPFNLPKGEGAIEALNRGLDEYVNEPDSSGLTQYELNDLPFTKEGIQREINSLLKNI